MVSRRQRSIRRAQEVVDDLGETLTSEQRRLLCRALQDQYEEEDEEYIDDDSETSESEGPSLRVRTIINVARPPSLGYVLGPLILQALISSFAIYLR